MPAPKGFWSELRGYHSTLLSSGKAVKSGWGHTMVRSAWLKTSENADEGYVNAVRWHGIRRLGGLLVGGVVDSIEAGGRLEGEISALATRKLFVYTLVPGVFSQLGTEIFSTDVRDLAVHMLPVEDFARSHDQGHARPADHDYGQLLRIMADGASGRHWQPSWLKEID